MSARRLGLASSLIPVSLLAAAGCQYDIDKIYKHVPVVMEAQLPADLIDLWKDRALPDDCVACARSECADDNTNCRSDTECAALTVCMAKADDPAAQADCRAQHTDWLRADISGRDVGGPYHTCVFLNKCAASCASHSQLACTGKFDWPTVNDTTVPLHLRFVEGLAGNPASDVKVRVCQSENPASCSELTPSATTDDDGIVDLNVKLQLGSFVGYLELEGGGLYPTLLRFGWPIARELTTNITVVSNANASLLVNSSDTPVSVSQERGFLQLRMFGCSGIPTRDVSFSVDKCGDMYTATWYTAGQEIFPNFDLTGTGDRGAGGIINVKSGRCTVNASHDGDTISTFSAPVRAGYMTIVFVSPGDSSMLM